MTSWLEPLGRDRARRARTPAREVAANGCAEGHAVAARSLEPAGGLWPLWGPRRAQWSAATAAPGSQAPRPHAERFRAIFAAMNASIVRLDTPLEPDVSAPAADRLLVGVPEHRVWNYFTDSTQTFFAGRWAGTRGKWRVRYTENELCVMTAGRVVITSDSGERSEFGTGAAFVIPSGFTGTWEVLEDCEKVYAIFEPRT